MESPIASSRPTARAAALAVLTAAILIVVLPASSAAVSPPFLACLVTGAWSGLDDPATGQLAAVGLRAAEGHGVVGRILHGATQAEVTQDLETCARNRAGITIGVGYGMSSAVDEVATAYPGSAFAIVDVDARTLTHRPKNVAGLIFKEQQAGYLAGYAAGLWAAARHGSTVGSVGGLDIPPVDRALAGFRFGAKRAAPGLRVLSGYSGDFAAPAKCQREALSQIGQGAVVEFQVAGPCGEGALTAARSKGRMAIGFGADQAANGPSVLTSVLDRADVAVASTIRDARSGVLFGGKNVAFGVGNGGIAIGTWSARVSPRLRRAVAAQLTLLKEGKLPPIPTTVP
jgi:basic membrane protein A